MGEMRCVFQESTVRHNALEIQVFGPANQLSGSFLPRSSTTLGNVRLTPLLNGSLERYSRNHCRTCVVVLAIRSHRFLEALIFLNGKLLARIKVELCRNEILLLPGQTPV